MGQVTPFTQRGAVINMEVFDLICKEYSITAPSEVALLLQTISKNLQKRTVTHQEPPRHADVIPICMKRNSRHGKNTDSRRLGYPQPN